ncbi:MAG: helicase, partial [Candidatus Accumulibacter sp.]|nr:helicase [Accumulibacter sp.]
DWVEDAAHWAERTRALEDKLSDALHQRLTQRFVDRRTAVLMRDLKVRGRDFGVEIDGDGSVTVEGESIGTLDGFRFKADPTARAGEKRMLLAAAERRLTGELAKRAQLLAGADDAAFALAFDGTMPPRIEWNGSRVGSMVQGRDALSPKLELDRSLDALSAADKAAVRARLNQWFATQRERQVGSLVAVSALTGSEGGVSPAARGLIVQLVENLGCLVRERVALQIAALDKHDRKMLAAAGVRLGVAHVFVKDLLRPEPTRWRLAMWAVHRGVEAAPAPPPAGRVTVEVESSAPRGFYDVAGFWTIEGQAVRIDMVERLAQAMHQKRDGRSAFIPDDSWVASVGMRREGFARLMRALGYRLKSVEGRAAFEWRGPRTEAQRPAGRAATEHSPFAILAGMRRG